MIPSGDQRYGAGEDSGVPSIIWRSGLNPGGWRRFSKPRFNTSNRAIDSLDCFCATLSYIVEGNDLKGYECGGSVRQFVATTALPIYVVHELHSRSSRKVSRLLPKLSPQPASRIFAAGIDGSQANREHRHLRICNCDCKAA